jgi:type II secretory pathway pseudopilin PulG
MPLGLNHLRQTGDTIIEVMVVLAVLGLAISISYTTANRSLLNARQAQENSEATELLQSQIESLRTLSANVPASPNYIFLPAAKQPFCVDPSGNVVILPLVVGLATPCRYSNLYDVTITYVPDITPGVVGGTFQLVATWPDVQDQGQDTVTLSYRYYQL